MKIPSNPERVCAQHAAEFWTGLLTFVGGRSGASDVSASEQRAVAIAAAGPAPGAGERLQIALAS
jgi:hypothetical protein